MTTSYAVVKPGTGNCDVPVGPGWSKGLLEGKNSLEQRDLESARERPQLCPDSILTHTHRSLPEMSLYSVSVFWEWQHPIFR